MNSNPDWQDGDACFRCRTQFSIVARKHHCRNCGNIFCAKCSSQQIPLPKLNMGKPVRVCDGCYNKILKKEETLAMATSVAAPPSTTTTNPLPPRDATAPSEQDLKEEEEFQLAMALSLSETRPKLAFPDFHALEKQTIVSDDRVQEPQLPQQQQQPPPPQLQQSQEPKQQQPQELEQLQQLQPQQQAEPNDQELFSFAREIQSISEIFVNRLNSSKIRNRPIATDSAIQSLFVKVTDMHSRLLGYIEKHESDRTKIETLQDKITRITDARAALDALREEHREKVLQKRQCQIASKLESMRQKKNQMMQYQKEIASQRIGISLDPPALPVTPTTSSFAIPTNVSPISAIPPIAICPAKIIPEPETPSVAIPTTNITPASATPPVAIPTNIAPAPAIVDEQPLIKFDD